MIKLNFRKNQRGIGLLELMLSLAIIAILLVMATRYFTITSGSSKLNQATSQVNEIKGGLAQWAVNNGSYAGATLQSLYASNFITQDTASGTNGWGGRILLNAAATPPSVQFTGLPADACNNLATRLKGTCSGGAVTVILTQ